MIPHDRRSASRVDTGNLVIHSEVGKDLQAQVLGMAVSLDLNEFGLRIQTAEPFDVGERFKFSLALQDEVVGATGRVVHLTQALNATWEVGIEFLQISSTDIDKIRRFCSTLPA